MYKKLLIEAGGGIISRSQQSEQADVATIAIGLGGTGISCLRLLKQEVYEKLRPDSEDSVIPEYKRIKFLAVDTDKNSLGSNNEIYTINDTPDEFFDISSSSISKTIENISNHKESYPQYSWLCTSNLKKGIEGIKIKEARNGACGVRQAGRMLLIEKSSQFVSKLKSIINVARADGGDIPLNIHIFTGLGGGTGAGTFLDVCYLVRHVVEEMTLEEKTDICGYFFLPDVNLSKPELPDETKIYVQSNGFASMKDLDYCMNFDKNGGEWEQQYDNFKINKTQAPPVDLAYLISATGPDGAVKSNGYNYAMHVAADCVFEFLTAPYIPEGAKDGEDDNVFTLHSHISNLNRNKSVAKKIHGNCYDYCILGASSAYLPYKDIMTYLASKIFASFKYLKKVVPNDNDIKEFINQSCLEYQNIYRELCKDVPSVKMYDVDLDTLKDQISQCEDANQYPKVLQKMVDSKYDINGKYTENAESLMEEVEVTVVDDEKSIKSLISRINKTIADLTKNPSFGPYFATEILHSVNTNDLQNTIAGYIDTNNEHIRNETATLNLRIDDLDLALSKAKKKTRKQNLKDYVAAFYNMQVQEAKLDSYKKLGSVLEKLSQQVKDLYDKYCKPFTSVLAELEETFEANLVKLSLPKENYAAYSKQIVKISDKELRTALDQTVDEMKLPDVLKNFIIEMLKNDEIWLGNDENEICNLVTKFFLSELSTFSSKSLTYYLQLKYNTTKQEELEKKVFDDILKPAYDLSDPLFWVDKNVFEIKNACKTGYCSVPIVSTEIKQATDNLKKNIDPALIERQIKRDDNISIFRFYSVVPLAGYKGVATYYKEYLNDRDAGKHLYENADESGKDFSLFPDLTPFSCLTEDYYRGNQKENSLIYDEAVQTHVVDFEEIENGVINKCFINIFDLSFVDNLVDIIDSAIKGNNIVKMKSVREQLPELPKTLDTRFVPNDGTVGHQKIVCKDNALNSLYLMQLIKEQIIIVRKYNDALLELEDAIERLNPQVYKDFIDAMCCDAIYRESRFCYKFKNSDGMFAEEIELTSRKKDAYGENVPLYSAFASYKNLSDEAKSSIKQKVDAIMDDDAKYEEIYLAKKPEIKELIATQGKEDSENARKLFPAEAQSIVNELEQLYKILA